MMLHKHFITAPDDEYLPRIEQIRKRAFAIFIERGGQHGYDLDDWLTAEEEFAFDLEVAA